MFKKLIVVFLSLLLLTSCGEEETNVLNAEGLSIFQWDKFSVGVPENWEILNDKENLLPEPSEGNIELSAQSKESKWGFFNNLLVLSDELNSFTDSTEFSIANNVWARGLYLDYNELDNKIFEFVDGTVSQLYVFEAKYNMETPKIKFIQTAYVCNPKTGYLLTLAVSPTIKKTDKYQELLSSFTCTPDEGNIEL